uniref:G_PROTEIN_RECEP_F1_2 domain-containing protein n=1 Tax=Macrostomum lignano TaxID=282301 RepID=A0A1I8HM29_9PLAT
MGIVSILKGEIYFMERRGLCLFVASICLVSCYCSLLSIAAIAINRYIHICRSSAYPSIFTRRWTLIMCCSLWIVSFLMEMPNFLGWGDHGYALKNLACLWDRLASRSYSAFFALVGVVLPS